jgi:hypothetical protein
MRGRQLGLERRDLVSQSGGLLVAPLLCQVGTRTLLLELLAQGVDLLAQGVDLLAHGQDLAILRLANGGNGRFQGRNGLPHVHWVMPAVCHWV